MQESTWSFTPYGGLTNLNLRIYAFAKQCEGAIRQSVFSNCPWPGRCPNRQTFFLVLEETGRDKMFAGRLQHQLSVCRAPCMVQDPCFHGLKRWQAFWKETYRELPHGLKKAEPHGRNLAKRRRLPAMMDMDETNTLITSLGSESNGSRMRL